MLIDGLRVMGIHRGYDKSSKKNVGIYFKEIIKKMENSIKC